MINQSTNNSIDKLQHLLLDNNLIINLTGRQRMISQKIAFLCELILRGDISKIDELEKVILLFENSLNVIKHGGIPPELETTHIISPLSASFSTTISLIENNWKIYKKSAENIIKFAAVGFDNSSISKEVMMMQIKIIENNCEYLLKSCNLLVSECSDYYQNRIIQLVNQQ